MDERTIRSTFTKEKIVEFGKLNFDANSWHAMLYREAYIDRRHEWRGLDYLQKQTLERRLRDEFGKRLSAYYDERRRLDNDTVLTEQEYREAIDAHTKIWQQIMEEREARKTQIERELHEQCAKALQSECNENRLSLCPYFHKVWWALVWFKIWPVVRLPLALMFVLTLIGVPVGFIVSSNAKVKQQKLENLKSYHPKKTVAQLEVILDKREMKKEQRRKQGRINDRKAAKRLSARKKRHNREVRQFKAARARDKRHKQLLDTVRYRRAKESFMLYHGYDPERMWTLHLQYTNAGRVYNPMTQDEYWASKYWNHRFNFVADRYTKDDFLYLTRASDALAPLHAKAMSWEPYILAASIVEYVAIALFLGIFLFLGFFPWMMETGFGLLGAVIGYVMGRAFDLIEAAWWHMVMAQQHTERGQFQVAALKRVSYILGHATVFIALGYALIMGARFVWVVVSNIGNIFFDTMEMVSLDSLIFGLLLTAAFMGLIALWKLTKGLEQVSKVVVSGVRNSVLLRSVCVFIYGTLAGMLKFIGGTLKLMGHYIGTFYTGICPNITFVKEDDVQSA